MEAFIHRKFLHTEAFTQKPLHSKPSRGEALAKLLHAASFHTENLWHTEASTHSKLFHAESTRLSRLTLEVQRLMAYDMLIAGEAQRNPRPWKVRLSHLHLFVSTHLSGLWIARLSELISDLILVSSPFSGCNQERDHPLCCFFHPPKAAETPVNQIKPSVCKPC